MVSADNVEVGSSFHHKGIYRVNVLECDFMTCCEGTTRWLRNRTIVRVENAFPVAILKPASKNLTPGGSGSQWSEIRRGVT